jgi:hypothetical protein
MNGTFSGAKVWIYEDFWKWIFIQNTRKGSTSSKNSTSNFFPLYSLFYCDLINKPFFSSGLRNVHSCLGFWNHRRLAAWVEGSHNHSYASFCIPTQHAGFEQKKLKIIIICFERFNKEKMVRLNHISTFFYSKWDKKIINLKILVQLRTCSQLNSYF